MATANTKRNPDADVNNLYNTLTDAVVSANAAGVFEGLKPFWDPCNGLGRLSKCLESETGVKCAKTSDKHDYGLGDETIDFIDTDDLGVDTMVPGVDFDHIVFNPPFTLTSDFLDQALTLTDKVYMFNRVSFLETEGRARKLDGRDWPLKKVWFFAYRTGCSKGVKEEAQPKAVMYAWYEFDKNYTGEPMLGWIFKPEDDLGL